MRLKFILDVDNLTLPLNYRYALQSFLYSCLETNRATLLHDDKTLKPFVFSNIIGKFKIEDKNINYSGQCFFLMASSDKTIIEDVKAYVESNGFINLYDAKIPIKRVELIKRGFEDSIYSYRTLSPIVIFDKDEDGKYNFYHPEDNYFIEALAKNIKHKYSLLYDGECPAIDIYDITNIKRRMCEYKGFYYTAYDLALSMNANKEIHQLVMDLGVGYRNPAGFGMLELVKK